MYDLVNNQFYTNSWTGTFSKGNDVTMSELKNAYIGEYVEPAEYLCFTAEQANSTIKLSKEWSPTAVTLETSTDEKTWSTYTLWATITLSNIWDKVYWRNTSTTNTWFSTGSNNYYYFTMTWSIAASGDVTCLINKNWWILTLGDFCFRNLFNSCSSLTSAPKLPSTTLWQQAYNSMFYYCSNLETIPALPATTIWAYCYNWLFLGCGKIKISASKTWVYQHDYRIPTSWTWSASSNWNNNMFVNTWWTFTSNPTINTTYYTSNTVV